MLAPVSDERGDTVLLTLLAVTVGLVGGYFRKGRVANIATLSPKWIILLIPALILYVAATLGVPGYSLNLTIVATFGLAVALFRNIEIKGAAIIGLGLILNLVVLVANGHVPVRDDAMLTVNDGAPIDIASLNALQQLEDADTVLPQLGDIIPVPLFNTIVSFGDLIALAGIAVLVTNATLRGQPADGLISVDDLFADFDEVTPTPRTIDLREQPSGVDINLDADQDLSDVVIKKSGQSVDFGQY